MYLSKYGVARHIYVPMVKRSVVDHAVGADWTPAAGDVKISKDGGASANVTNLPTAIAMGNSALWDFSLTATEMQAAQIMITVADSATKAVEDNGFVIETYGNASGQHAVDLADSVRAGLTALPNAAAEAAGGLYTRGSGAGQINQTNNGQVDANAARTGGTTNTGRDIGASVLVGGYVAGQDVAVRRGTAQAGASGSITLDASASATDNLYQWMAVVVLSGTGVGQARIINGYTGSTKVATVAPNWTTNPDNTSLFAVLPLTRQNVGYLLETIFSTPATAGILDVNLKNIANATVSASTAQLGVNVVNFGGAAGTFASGRPEVNASHWRGTALPVEDTAGYPKVTIKDGTGTGEIDTNAGAIVAVTTVTTTTNLTNAPPDSSGVTTLLSRLSAARAAMLDALSLRTGTAQGGAAGTITLDASASATNDLYKGQWVVITSGTGAGQSRMISAYVGATKVATIHRNWATNPDNTSVFYLLSAADIYGVVLADTITTYTGDTPQTGDSYARLGAPAGVSIAADVAGVQSDTDNIQTRIPAALVSGRIDASVGAMAADVVTATAIQADAITAAKIAADAIGASELATDAVTEIVAAVFARAFSVAYGSYTFDELVKQMVAVLLGKASGLAGTTATYRNLADSADVIVATVDADGNRSAVTRTP